MIYVHIIDSTDVENPAEYEHEAIEADPTMMWAEIAVAIRRYRQNQVGQAIQRGDQTPPVTKHVLIVADIIDLEPGKPAPDTAAHIEGALNALLARAGEVEKTNLRRFPGKR
jgi:hypothetical protein